MQRFADPRPLDPFQFIRGDVLLDVQDLEIGGSGWPTSAEKIASWVRDFYGPSRDNPDIWGPFYILTSPSKLLIVCRELWKQWRKEYAKPDDVQTSDVGNWVLEWTGEDKRHLLDIERLASIEPRGIENPIGIWFDCKAPDNVGPPSPLAKAWVELIREPVIPWDISERRRVLAHAYKELAEEIKRWKEITAWEKVQEEAWQDIPVD